MGLGIAYLRDNRAAMRIVILMTAITFPLMQAGLMSIMAKDVLHGDEKTMGFYRLARVSDSLWLRY